MRQHELDKPCASKHGDVGYHICRLRIVYCCDLFFVLCWTNLHLRYTPKSKSIQTTMRVHSNGSLLDASILQWGENRWFVACYRTTCCPNIDHFVVCHEHLFSPSRKMLTSIGKPFEWTYTVDCTLSVGISECISGADRFNAAQKCITVCTLQSTYVVTRISVFTGAWFVEFVSPQDKIVTVLPESQKLTVIPVLTHVVTLPSLL